MNKLDDLLTISKNRRTYRKFLSDGFSVEEIKKCIEVASYAPNGANKQPWHFTLVTSQEMKDKIYKKAVEIEKEFYDNKITKEWKNDLDHLVLDYDKPFLKEAPGLIVIFKEAYKVLDDGRLDKNYYVNESVGLATGMLINALNVAGYASLTYTPAPMTFLKELLNRPVGESAFMILVVGKADKSYELPNITKKDIDDIMDIV